MVGTALLLVPDVYLRCHLDEPDENFYDQTLADNTLERLQYASGQVNSTVRLFLTLQAQRDRETFLHCKVWRQLIRVADMLKVDLPAPTRHGEFLNVSGTCTKT